MNGRVYYLSYYGYEKSVIDSQVIVPMKLLSDSGFPVTLIFFEKIFGGSQKMAWLAAKKQELKDKGLNTIFLPRIPRNFLGLNSLTLFFALIPAFLSKEKVVIHARGFQGAACALALKCFKKVRIICDARGLESDEYEMEKTVRRKRPLNGLESWWKSRLEKIMTQAVSQSDAVFTVSRALKNTLLQRGMPAQARWEYNPCSVDVTAFSGKLPERESLRKKRGWMNRLVVVYSGSSHAWQMVSYLPVLFKKIQTIEPSAFFLGLTPDPSTLRRLFQDASVSPGDYVIESIPYKDIPEALVSADMGVLLREENPVNANSCPTKFAEYLAAGLHVLSTPAILDMADIIRTKGVGTLLSDVSDVNTWDASLTEAIKKAHDVLRRIPLSAQVAQEQFDWQNYVPRIKKWYLELLQK